MNTSSLMVRGLSALCLTAALAAPALAVPINPINTRPEPVGSPASGEQSLQWILDNKVGAGFDAAGGQSSTGMWSMATQPYITSPIIVAEYAGNATTNAFGIWYGTDSSSIYTVQLFSGANTAGDFATLTYSVNGSGRYVLNVTTASGTTTKDDLLGRITPSSFGFYLQAGTPSGPIYYSVDSLNSGGTAMMLAYQSPTFTDTWVFAAEDTLPSPLGNGDRDFNDMVVKVESVKAVPEPASLLLLGNGILAMGAWAMTRRKNQA